MLTSVSRSGNWGTENHLTNNQGGQDSLAPKPSSYSPPQAAHTSPKSDAGQRARSPQSSPLGRGPDEGPPAQTLLPAAYVNWK